MVNTCPSDNSAAVDQTSFWSSGTLHAPHRVGWIIGGGCSALTVLISIVSVLGHCRNYTNRRQQRQILRILYMPPVYAVISFLSYRFFRDYTYYSLVEVVYEAFTISAFLLLLIEYVADSASGHSAENAIARKEKRRLMIPLCCWRYRPTKAYFMYTVKWAVLQYVIFRPLVSIVGIVCQALNILCESEGFSVKYANVYLEAVDFVSISFALYGLLLFYSLTKDELKGRRPLAKFLSIKLIVMFTWYQSFVFSALSDRVLKATQYWTTTNIANGLNALAVCIEMIFFSALMMWSFTYNEYKRKPGTPATSIWRPLWDSINYADFALEIFGSLRFFLCGAQTATNGNSNRPIDFGEAFGVSGRKRPTVADPLSTSENNHDMQSYSRVTSK
ncbi:organic solute transporter Ostalpha-domain-containing protein [Mycena alexandri]|uniref:Organic solute transporter Ostalpha-domain-containing protein n=1 Tax=Mycena alexandri TaxID=1745969 RepID=A0AAD6TKL4_9AGAR|nr:organic solute transporter Ostalpha-domain-containing protein [Mycena alexandri]